MAPNKHDIEQINHLRSELVAMLEAPANRQAMSVHRAVTLLATEIEALRTKGYTYAMISDALRSHGLAIAGPTLGTYMARLRRAQVLDKDQLENKLAKRSGATNAASAPRSIRKSLQKGLAGPRRKQVDVVDAPRTPGGFVPPPDNPDL